jgi:hypothetical protein
MSSDSLSTTLKPSEAGRSGTVPEPKGARNRCTCGWLWFAVPPPGHCLSKYCHTTGRQRSVGGAAE